MVAEPDPRVGQTDLLHNAEAVSDLDPVPEPDRLRHRDQDARHEVRERAPSGQPDDEADDRRGREDAARDRAHLRDGEQRRDHADEDDAGDDRATQHPIPRHRFRWELTPRQAAVDDLCDHRRDEQDAPEDGQALPGRHGGLFDGSRGDP
jgi:hypothetical protein